MPEYLSPGVFVEELPPQLRALEGVSTSTAAFVGPARRGTVAGYPLPFTPTGSFVLVADAAPLLVTSFGDFVRAFGQPLPLPLPTSTDDTGYLGYAARAFFDNGGKRLYVSRVVNQTASTRSTLRLGQGVVLRLLRPVKKGANKVFFNSSRGVSVGTSIAFNNRADGRPALVNPAKPATITGSGAAVEPFALVNGDSLTINAGTGVTITIAANPAQLVSGATAFTGATLNGTVLKLIVNGVPRSMSFSAIPSPAAVSDVVTAVNGAALGVVASSSAGHLLLTTSLAGLNAGLSSAGGSADAVLGGLALPTPYSPPSSSNVADVGHVSVAEIAQLFAGPVAALIPSQQFMVGKDASGHIAFTSVATGATAALTDAGSMVGATKLGLGAAVAGVNATPAAAPTVISYNNAEGSVTLSAGVVNDLDPSEVYATLSSVVVTGNGPRFFARSPGSWSEDVDVLIAPSDRAAVPIIGPFPVLAGSTTVQVMSTSSFYVGAVVEIDHGGVQRAVYEVTAISGKTLTISPGLVNPIPAPPMSGPNSFVRTLEIDVTIIDETGSAPVELYKGLSWNQSSNADVRRHYASQINARSRLVYVQPPATGLPPLAPPGTEGPTLAEQPTSANGFPLLFTSIGNDGLPTTDDDYVGTDAGPGLRTGIESLADVTEARILAVPGKTTAAVQLALISQCELLRYRFAILDGEQDPAGGSLNAILAHRSLYDSSFAALYAPWVGITIGDDVRYLPPSGFAAGVFARVDNERGLGKAPGNESLFNVVRLKTNFTTGEQDILNPRGVNLIRRFDVGGIRIWGARTLSSDPSVKYINVRRILIFIEASIDQGTQWVVFEPNDANTWARVTATISNFLDTQWRNGLLFGRSPEQAFYVRCDETTMTADDIQNGRLICLIGLAVVRPAEFVIFRLEQITGFANQ